MLQTVEKIGIFIFLYKNIIHIYIIKRTTSFTNQLNPSPYKKKIICVALRTIFKPYSKKIV